MTVRKTFKALFQVCRESKLLEKGPSTKEEEISLRLLFLKTESWRSKSCEVAILLKVKSHQKVEFKIVALLTSSIFQFFFLFS